MTEAHSIIDRLALQPHPEGGWYRETWRADAAPGERAGATAIYFLLEAGQRSHWHRVDAAELWLWHAGAPLRLLTAPADAGPVHETILGPEVAAGHAPQGLVAPHHWQSTETTDGWALVSCIVSPGFEFAGFTLAEPGWAPA
jgi:predicted cupin superfamily sugar epimerase